MERAIDLSERSVQRAWEREYAQRGRLWGGTRLDGNTDSLLASEPELGRGRWLDAGCGDGKGLVPLLARLDDDVPVIVALDTSRSALEHARDGVRNRHGLAGLRRVRLLQSDVLRPGLDAASFDVVRAVFLVGHLRAPRRELALRSLHRLLRPEGRFVASEFSAGDFRSGKGEAVEPGTMRRGTGVETHYFEREELQALLVRAGFSIKRLRTVRFQVHYGGQTLDRERFDVVAGV